MKQTAVEWLFLMLNNPNKNQDFANKLFNKAIEIEKQQIIEAYKEGMGNVDGWIVNKNGIKEYYNETYENKENI